MTRVIKNKAVVPKDYITSIAEQSYAALSMTATTTHDIALDSNLLKTPFELTYERAYSYEVLNDTKDLGWGRPAYGPVDIIYNIAFNITTYNSSSLRFFRFIINPNIYLHITKQDSFYPSDYNLPIIKLTVNEVNANGGISSTNSISIELDTYNPSARIVGGNTNNERYYKSEIYSIVYDALDNKIYNDTENGVNFWGEEQTSAASENGVMTTSMDDEVTPVADTPSFDFGGNVQNMFNFARIDKAVVPQDYARLIHTVADAASIASINTVTHDLTTIDVSSLPNYDMVGEIKCVYPAGTIKSINGTGNRIYYITRKFNLNPVLVNKYRLIRLIVQPNINLLVSTGPITLYFQVEYVIDGVSYSNNILLANRFTAGNLISTGTKEYAFIFDTKTQEFYNDTSNGIGLWSNKYTSNISDTENGTPKL